MLYACILIFFPHPLVRFQEMGFMWKKGDRRKYHNLFSRIQINVMSRIKSAFLIKSEFNVIPEFSASQKYTWT